MNRTELNYEVMVGGDKAEAVNFLMGTAHRSEYTNSFVWLEWINKVVDCGKTLEQYGIDNPQYFYFTDKEWCTWTAVEDEAQATERDENIKWYELIVSRTGYTINKIEFPDVKEQKKFKVVTYTFTKKMVAHIDIAIPEDADKWDYTESAEEHCDDADWEDDDWGSIECDEAEVQENDLTADEITDNWDVMNEYQLERWSEEEE